MFNFLARFFRSDFWILREYEHLETQVLNQWKTIEKFSLKRLLKESKKLQKNLKGAPQKTITKNLVQAYALAAESIFRVHKLRLYPVQILGAIALHFGNVSEMKTGEGKTLTALLPAYLNALTGRTVYIVTVNEYLVKRDQLLNEAIFINLGMRLGSVLGEMNHDQKKENYQHNIIYVTNSELGFDYLRDNMLPLGIPKIQKDLFYVIIDEADSILIDEARTPLVISGNPINRQKLYVSVNHFVKSLKPTDYRVNKEFKLIFLTKSGFIKANSFFVLSNFQTVRSAELFHLVQNSLYAHYILMKNIDYLVRNKKILLIDHFTGRVLGDRSLSHGLHQSLEVKEGVPTRPETSVLATITYQNFFRLFDKIAGMTGTAVSVEEEFMTTYNMHVLQIPTNRPMIRIDAEDYFFLTKKAKYLALATEIERLYKRKQPVLVGSNSVQTSDDISQLLRYLKIPHSVLSAKHHSYEAKIIANAGKNGSVTIATNIAGRGTDIILDETAKKLGGLVVLGAERNESERIDRQLRGRSGRQGEPGYAKFYVSLDDELLIRFGSQVMKKRFGIFGNKPFTSGLFRRFVRRVQSKLTNLSFDQRKTLLDFDNIVSQQRSLIYVQRDFLQNTSSIKMELNHFFKRYIELFLNQFWPIKKDLPRKKVVLMVNNLILQKIIYPKSSLPVQPEFWSRADFNFWLQLVIIENWNKIKDNSEIKIIHVFCRQVILQAMDKLWVAHLNELMRIKSASFLHSYAQKRPLERFIEEATELFRNFQNQVALNAAPIILKFSWSLPSTQSKTKSIALNSTATPVDWGPQ